MLLVFFFFFFFFFRKWQKVTFLVKKFCDKLKIINLSLNAKIA